MQMLFQLSPKNNKARFLPAESRLSGLEAITNHVRAMTMIAAYVKVEM